MLTLKPVKKQELLLLPRTGGCLTIFVTWTIFKVSLLDIIRVTLLFFFTHHDHRCLSPEHVKPILPVAEHVTEGRRSQQGDRILRAKTFCRDSQCLGGTGGALTVSAVSWSAWSCGISQCADLVPDYIVLFYPS